MFYKFIKIFCISILALIVLVVCVVIGGTYYAVYKDEKAWIESVRTLIPNEIKIEEVVTSDFQYSLPGGSCSGVSFKLSENTLDNIKHQGLSYFKNLAPNQTQTYRGKTDTWRPWQATPIKNEDDKNSQLPLGCLNNFKKFLDGNNYLIGAQDTQGYYTYVTYRGATTLWIFPEWEIIVYSYHYL